MPWGQRERRSSLSGGTLYPILHGMEQKGYLKSSVKRTPDGRRRRIHRVTPAGSGQAEGT
jgi:DNA-binding PadR family transcriptional regulator